MALHHQIEIKIRSSAKSKELTMHCSDCWPRELTVIPWCPLLLEDTSNPPSTAYFQLHKLDSSKGETVDGVYHKYEERVPNLKCLFVIAPSKEVHSLSNWLTGNPFLLVIIPEKHKKKILELCDSELEATIAVEYTESSEYDGTLESLNYVALMKALKLVVHNDSSVSLCQGLPGICPANKRLLAYFIEVLDTEDISEMVGGAQVFFTSEMMMHFFLRNAYFDTIFKEDFLFFFNIIDLTSTFSFRSDAKHDYMLKCLQELLKIPVKKITKQLTQFIEKGDFKANNSRGLDSVFEYTATAILKFCEICCKLKTKPENLLYALIVSTSVAVKLLSSKGKSAKTANIWTKLTEYYKQSGFKSEDMLYLEEGLHSMTMILDGHAELMASFKDFSVIFTTKIYPFATIKKFITISVRHLVRLNQDASFRVDFLQPVTTAYLNALLRKRVIFIKDAKEVVHHGKEVVVCLVSLINMHNWDLSDYEMIIKDWIKILFNINDLSDPISRNQFIEWIDREATDRFMFWESYMDCFNNELECLLMKQCHALPDDVFVALVPKTTEHFNKSKVIVEYIRKSGIQRIYNEAPNIIVLALNNVTNSDNLISYLKHIMEGYIKSNQFLKFLTDFMSLNVHPVAQNFEKEILALVSTQASILNWGKLQKDELHSFFSSFPMTSNSLNWLITKEILKKLPLETNETVLEIVLALFSSDLREADFSSTRIRGALFAVNLALQGALLDDFACLWKHRLVLFVLSKSFRVLWNAFATTADTPEKNCTLEAFEMRVKNIPELQETVNKVYMLISLLLSSSRLVRAGEVTHDDLEAFLSSYEIYESINECIMCLFDDTQYFITKDEVREYLARYNSCVSEIENLLVRKPDTLPDLARQNIKSALAGYGIFFPVELDAHLNSVVSPSSVTLEDFESESSEMCTHIIWTYQANPGCTLSALETFAACLRKFLYPLHGSISDVLVFSSLYKSHILTKCIKHFQTYEGTDSIEIKLEKLSKAVQEALRILKLLVKDPENLLTLKVVKEIFQRDVARLDLNSEDKKLRKFYRLISVNHSDVRASESLTTFYELEDISKHIKKFQLFASKFDLSNYLEDPILQRLLKKANDVAIQSPITSKDAKAEVLFIKETFRIECSLIDHPLFSLLSHLGDCTALYRFALKRGYGSPDGMDVFLHERRVIIKADLQFDCFSKELLSMLVKAMELVHLFFDETCSLVQLCYNITDIGDITSITHSVLTVNDNIEIIKGWFNQTNELITASRKLYMSSIELSNSLRPGEADSTLEKTIEELKINVAELEKEQLHWVLEKREIEVLTKEKLGQGGWGIVCKAKFRGITVAAKCLYDEILSHYNISIFNREMELSSHLRHPNLVQFIGATQDKHPIILTELMSTSLRKELEKKPLTKPVITAIGFDVSAALNYLHLSKPHVILHRDVSSSNVLLEPFVGPREWRAKLSDFGSANFLHQVSSRSTYPGSPAYSAPEAQFPHKHSPAMDVYSFGVLLMEMSLCCAPSMNDAQRNVQAREIKMSPFKTIVQKCLSHNQGRRPNMSQVLKDLS